jgi:hypothetical protein
LCSIECFAVSMATAAILKFLSLKTIDTHAIQHFYYVSSNSEHFKLLTFFVATAAILKFLSLKIMCTHVRQNVWKVSSSSEHHRKPTMNINSQHHNLLGNQISPKSEDNIWTIVKRCAHSNNVLSFCIQNVLDSVKLLC